MQKRYNLFIDGQNVPIDYIPAIMDYCTEVGLEQEHARLYASTTEITKIVAKNGTLLADYDIDPVPVSCKPRKNSVDIRIAVDVIEEAVEDTDSDVVIVATNDSDFTHVASRVISYKSEFHLLHTGGAPSGYSQRVKMTRLKARSKREQIAAHVKKVTATLRPSGERATPPAAQQKLFAHDPEYSHDTSIAKLSVDGFAMRILAVSPIAIDSRSLFQAWKDFTGHAWKGRNSKKSATKFFEEHFPVGEYRFVQWNDSSTNVGYFLHRDYASIAVVRQFANPTFSLLGADGALLREQCRVIAEAMNAASYENFNFLYDASQARNLLPRYGCWAIVEAWRRNRGDAEHPPKWTDPLEQDSSVDGEALHANFEAAIRSQFESGDLALEPLTPPD